MKAVDVITTYTNFYYTEHYVPTYAIPSYIRTAFQGTALGRKGTPLGPGTIAQWQVTGRSRVVGYMYKMLYEDRYSILDGGIHRL